MVFKFNLTDLWINEETKRVNFCTNHLLIYLVLAAKFFKCLALISCSILSVSLNRSEHGRTIGPSVDILGGWMRRSVRCIRRHNIASFQFNKPVASAWNDSIAVVITLVMVKFEWRVHVVDSFVLNWFT